VGGYKNMVTKTIGDVFCGYKNWLQNHRERDLVTKPQRVTKNQGCILVTKP
jgi:hypothetical protein